MTHIKKIALLLGLVTSMLLLVSCKAEPPQAVTYVSDNNEYVQIEVAGGKDLYQDGKSPFTIYKGGKGQLFGAFAPGDLMDFYRAFIEEDESATIIEEGEKNGNEYIFYKVDYIEFEDTSSVSVDLSDIFGFGTKENEDNEDDEDGEPTQTASYCVIEKVAGTDICVAMSGSESEEAFKTAYDALTITKVDAPDDASTEPSNSAEQ